MSGRGAGDVGKKRRRPTSDDTASARREELSVETLPPARYLFFGGKGGTGKTTAACAAALLLLEQAAPGESLLLFSTDPAHSLSDSLNAEVGDRVAEVARRGRGARAARLFAREMDAPRALEEFKSRHRAVLAEIADRGTLLDEADIDQLLGLSLPGMDEVMALFELSEFARAQEFARVVVDTAPSGHTSRMLRLPEVFARWLRALDVLAEKHRHLVAHFARARRPREDDVDRFLRELSERVGRVSGLLHDPAQTSFTLVTIPEAMAVEETARYLALLRRERIPVTDLIVNRVGREREECPFCRARARGQARWLRRLAREFGDLRLRRVPLLPAEVRGPQALREFARLAWGAAGESESLTKPGGGETQAGEFDQDSRGARLAAPRLAGRASLSSAGPSSSAEWSSAPAHFSLEPRRLMVFGGKGGVGKTTAAAAAALALAGRDSSARVLLFSTDPAHSLSDAFGEPIGELKRGAGGRANLDATEIDPASRFEELKARYRAWIDELFESLTGGSRWQVQFDREAMREMIALAPPGVDEIAALSGVSDQLEGGAYSSIVLDTAPAGHLIRFLELPEVALSWAHTFIRLLLKYKSVVRWGGVAEELVALSRSIKRVISLLTDAGSCEFVGVAIPERMSLEETVRLAAALERLRVPMRRLLVNHVVTGEAAAACDFCAARRRAQSRALADFRRRLNETEIFVAPEHPHEVRGPARLRRHFASWRAAPDFGNGRGGVG